MITNRDIEIVDWIGRLGAADPGHVMARFGMGRTVTYRRLAALEAAGLIERSRLLHAQSGLNTATRAGLRLCGLEDLGLARVSAASVAHWQASTTVAVLLERRHGYGNVGGVREIRAAERATGCPGRHLRGRLLGAPARPGRMGSRRPWPARWRRRRGRADREGSPSPGADRPWLAACRQPGRGEPRALRLLARSAARRRARHRLHRGTAAGPHGRDACR